jgi:hypothetical protein
MSKILLEIDTYKVVFIDGVLAHIYQPQRRMMFVLSSALIKQIIKIVGFLLQPNR